MNNNIVMDDDTFSVPLVNLYGTKYLLGPIFENYFQRSIVQGLPDTDDIFQNVKDDSKKAVLVEHMLFNVTIIPTDPIKYTRNAKFIPGVTFDGRVGPRADISVVIINKIPDDKSVPLNRDNLSFGLVPILDQLLGYTKDFLIQVFIDAGFSKEVWSNFYVTNLCRFPRIDAGLKKTVPAAWIKEGLPFLEQELKIIKPDYIICMGTDASKKIVGCPITKALSNVFDYDIDGHNAKVVCVNDSKKIIEDPEGRPLFLSGFEVVRNMMHGKKTQEKDRSGYHYIDNDQQLSDLVDMLTAEGCTEFAIDCEWGGNHYLDVDAGLRTIQIAWSEKDVAVIILKRQHMKKAFTPYLSNAFIQLRRLLQRPTVKFIGHNIAADYPWLKDAGLDLASQVYFDTMLASHLFEPTMSHSLEDLAAKHIRGWVRQDSDLVKWIDDNKKVKGHGYAHIPDKLLHPYGGDDAISTFMLYRKYQRDLAKPENKGLADLFYSLVMPAVIPLINIEMTGVLMDRERIIKMCNDYKDVYDRLTLDFRNSINNPTFNPASDRQKQKLLYVDLGLKPVKTTDKPPLMWEEVEERGLENQVSPAVDSETLDILSAESEIAARLHEISLLGTVLKNQLVPPKLDEKGDLVYLKGFAGFIKSDGRIHTRISQMLKTGRLASLDPNIMNIAKKQEFAVQDIFKAQNIHVPKLRSVFTVPVGMMMVTADYRQAELAALAYMSGDTNLITAVKTGQDIHSVVCKQMFQLDCTLKEVKLHHTNLRVAAKSIVFGLLYGRGKKAIAREVNKAGVEMSVEQAGEFIQKFMNQFPSVAVLIARTHLEVEQRGWVETTWGRRAFYPSVKNLANAKQLLAGQKRKAFNFKVQGYVGDLLRAALINFYRYKAQHPEIKFNIILTVHDS
ncbi:MAG TPA: hypothetical protein ENK70_08885, partial [Methylophaga sp.]|nr:hypothetical protein [Methylophaga sp.]